MSNQLSVSLTISLIGLMLQLSALLRSTQYYFKHYQADDGLMHNTVAGILEYSKRLVWIGLKMICRT